MRIGVMGDIDGNLPALRAVLDDLRHQAVASRERGRRQGRLSRRFSKKMEAPARWPVDQNT